MNWNLLLTPLIQQMMARRQTTAPRYPWDERPNPPGNPPPVWDERPSNSPASVYNSVFGSN